MYSKKGGFRFKISISYGHPTTLSLNVLKNINRLENIFFKLTSKIKIWIIALLKDKSVFNVSPFVEIY